MSTLSLVLCVALFGVVTDADTTSQALEIVTRQLMQLQSHVENSKRIFGASGIKAMRSTDSGNRPYHGGSYAEKFLAGMHTHSDHTHAIGLGEIVGVLNGVEFATRHNDYKMKSRSRSSSTYGELEDIDLPDVPPEVLNKATVEEQIDEMREWFKAWAEQNHTMRDYRPYFRPVLCYLEGAWFHSDLSTIEESFESDRHLLDATSWLDLQEKAVFNMETGHKDLLENYATLPTRITGIGDDGLPQLAQWNYNILCHKLNDDLPLNRFELSNDLQTRMKLAKGKSLRQMKVSSVARFRLNVDDSDSFSYSSGRTWRLMDEMMSQIPGLDNYQVDLRDDAYGSEAGSFTASMGPLNAGYYHRWIRHSTKDANGIREVPKTFKDDQLYMAMTTHERVVPHTLTVCRRGDCSSWTQRWTYAVPLEIIYTTPLTAWNPYNIIMNDEVSVVKDADGNVRNGENDPMKAYNGSSYNKYYQIPGEFFEGEVDRSPADTAADSYYVLDSQGNVRFVRASGHRIFHPNIPGIGILRQRYPIFPIFEEGTATWKELSALKDVYFNPGRWPQISHDTSYESPYYTPDTLHLMNRDVIQEALDGIYELPASFVTAESKTGKAHSHIIELTPEEVNRAINDDWPTVTTSPSEGHTHQVVVALLRRVNSGGKESAAPRIKECDGYRGCLDGHGQLIYRLL